MTRVTEPANADLETIRRPKRDAHRFPIDPGRTEFRNKGSRRIRKVPKQQKRGMLK